jgi:ABC-2 type transport system ATP-binding protein
MCPLKLQIGVWLMSILEMKNISKKFGNRQVLKNISFSIEEGEVVGFVGSNGAGKTTTLKVLANLIFPDEGTVVINGHNLFSEREEALSCIGGIIENPGLYSFLSGRDNLNFIKNLRNVSDEKMDSIIEYIGLSSRINDTVKNYSLGMKQRLALGMSLLTDPKLLILDEPTNGLDPTGTIELRNLLKKLSKENKISVLISSHILSEIDKISDKVVFIKEGEIISIKDNKRVTNGQPYKMNVNEAEKVKELLKNCENVYEFYFDNENVLYVNIANDSLNSLLKSFVLNNIDFSNIEVVSGVEEEYDKIYSKGALK